MFTKNNLLQHKAEYRSKKENGMSWDVLHALKFCIQKILITSGNSILEIRNSFGKWTHKLKK